MIQRFAASRYAKRLPALHWAARGAIVALALMSMDTTGWSAVTTELSSYYDQAKASLKAGDINAAAIQLKNAIRADESNVDARLALAQIYLSRFDGASAETELRAALAHGMPRERVMLPLAQALFLQQKSEALLKDIDPNLLHGHDAAVLYGVRARAQLMLRHMGEAEAEVNKALAIEPKLGPALVTRSQILQSQGKLPEAQQAIDSALAVSPDFVEAIVQKGNLLEQQGDAQQAITEFSRAIKLDAKNLAALIGRAQAEVSQGKFDDARRDVDAALKSQPNNSVAGYFDAFLLGHSGKYQAATERLQRIPGIENYPPALYLSASLHYMLGDLERARDAADKYVTRVPDNVAGKTLLAAIELRQAEPQKAIEQLQPIVTDSSEDFKAMALLATAYMMAKQPTKAVELYDRALKLHPDNAAVRLQLAKSHLSAGDPKQAVDELESIIAASPDSAEASALLVVSLVSQGRLDEAEKAANAFRQRAADKPLPLYLLASVAASRNDMTTARQHFEEALKVDPDFFQASLSLAALDRQQGHAVEAKQRYQDLLSRSPNNVLAMLGLAQLAIDAHDNNAALNLLDKAAAADAKDPRPRVAKVELLLTTGQTEPALLAAREFQTSAPNSPVALKVLAGAQLAAGRQDDAIETYRSLVALAADAADSHYLLGQALRQSGKQEEAAAEFDAATGIAPTMIDAWRARLDIKRKAEGIAAARALAQSLNDRIGSVAVRTLEAELLIAEKQYGDAAELYRALYKEKPSAGGAVNLADALALAGQKTEGIAVLTDWLSGHPDDTAVRFALSTRYIESGQLDAARAESERILVKAPDFAANLNNLAWLYGETGDKDKALTHARRAYELAPGNPSIADTLGWLLAQQGDIAAAMPLLTEASKGSPDNAEIGYHYAWVLVKDGKKAQAAKVLTGVLQSSTQFPERKDAEQLGATLKGS